MTKALLSLLIVTILIGCRSEPAETVVVTLNSAEAPNVTHTYRLRHAAGHVGSYFLPPGQLVGRSFVNLRVDHRTSPPVIDFRVTRDDVGIPVPVPFDDGLTVATLPNDITVTIKDEK